MRKTKPGQGFRHSMAMISRELETVLNSLITRKLETPLLEHAYSIEHLTILPALWF